MQHHLLEYNDLVRTKLFLYLFKKILKMYNVNAYNNVIDSPFDSHHSDSTSRSPTQPFVSSPIESPASTTASRSSSPPQLNSPFESYHSDSTSRSSSLSLQPFNSLFDSNHSDSPSRSTLLSPPLLVLNLNTTILIHRPGLLYFTIYCIEIKYIIHLICIHDTINSNCVIDFDISRL